MDHNTFMKTLDYIFTKTQSTLVKKRDEYASNIDIFHNIKTAAAFLNCSPEEAAFGFLTKHLVSLSDMCQADNKEYSYDIWEEKLGDSINYLTLIWAMHKEKEDIKLKEETSLSQNSNSD